MELKKVNTHWREGWRFTTGQEAVITTAEALYTHMVQPGAGEEKYRPQTREQEASTHYTPTASHLAKPGPSCVSSSQLLHHPEPCLIYSLLRSRPTEPTYKYGGLLSVALTLTEGVSEAKALCAEVKPLYRQAPKEDVTEENHFL